jgi:cytochrome c553
MKKITLLSLAAATLLFTACGEETKKVVEEVNKTKVVEAVKKDTISAFEAAKIKMAEAAEAAKIAAAEMAAEAKVEAEKMAAAAEEKAAEYKAAAESNATEAAAVVEEKTAELTQAATAALTSISAPAAYDKCKGCHGADGKTAALGKSAIIAGQDKEALITSMNEYKAGTKNVVGMGALMTGQAATMSDEEIEAVAEYLSQI